MKLPLTPVTFCTLLLTGTLLNQAGWFAGKGTDRPAPRKTETRVQAQAHDSLNTEAAWRFRRCQPSHWRAMVLQR